MDNIIELKVNEKHTLPIDHELEFVLINESKDEDLTVKYLLNNQEKKKTNVLAGHNIRTTYEADGELTIINEGPALLKLGIE